MARAVFLQGSTLKHILVMTSANSLGLLMLFTVDLVDMYFLSLLGQSELAAAVGFAGTLLFFLTSISIGLQIAMGALVARAEGSHDRPLAARYCTNVLIYSAVTAAVVSLPAWLYLEQLLAFLGARGQTFDYALAYSRILLPSTPLLALGMGAAAALRAIGDARRSAYVTMAGAVANALLDPLCIFGFGWGIEGAAAASFASRVVLVVVGMLFLLRIHRLPAPVSFNAVSWQALKGDMPAITAVAAPAMLTNLATPIGSSFVLKVMADFGDSAVAGAAILGRLAPVAFAALFALSGAVGPIIGQNAGAGRYDRVMQTVRNAMLSAWLYVLLVWLLLFLLNDLILQAFEATGQAAELITFYTHWLVAGFGFTAMLFIANASFNNLGRAYWATLLNFGRSLLGTIPVVYLCAEWFGPRGVVAGEIIGTGLFGLLGTLLLFRSIASLQREHAAPLRPAEAVDDGVQWPLSSAQSQMAVKLDCIDSECLKNDHQSGSKAKGESRV